MISNLPKRLIKAIDQSDFLPFAPVLIHWHDSVTKRCVENIMAMHENSSFYWRSTYDCSMKASLDYGLLPLFVDTVATTIYGPKAKSFQRPHLSPLSRRLWDRYHSNSVSMTDSGPTAQDYGISLNSSGYFLHLRCSVRRIDWFLLSANLFFARTIGVPNAFVRPSKSNKQRSIDYQLKKIVWIEV